MDFHLKQWRNQDESEQHHPAKLPKLVLETHQQQPKPELSGSSSVLPLFLPETNSKIASNLSAFPDSTPTSSARLPRMGSYFSLVQYQELELQVLIYRYFAAGAAVPQELLQPIKKSLLLHTTPYFLHNPLQHYPHYQPALFQSGYWGRAAMDPEPGRCRRTDGKKWRCSRDVVVGQKYCERHVHRGRNRSRKPVEIPTPTTQGVVSAGGGTTSSMAAQPLGTGSGGTHFSLSNTSSIDLFQSSLEAKSDRNKDLSKPHNDVSGSGKSDGHILRHFFDDWPRSLQDSENGGSNGSPMNSSTSLSISISGNSSSDVSLKLSTGNGEESGHQVGQAQREQPQLNWASGWASSHMGSMGGPLAEALRSSNSSPTSVLHQLARGSASETSFVSA